MGSSKRVRVNRRSSIKSSRKQAEANVSGVLNQQSVKSFRGTAASDDSVLILVKGDPFSRAVEKDARQAGFSGQFVKLSTIEAGLQATPLPLLIIGKNHETLGPDELVKYFKKK